MLIWKALHDRAPKYISELISERDLDRDLRSGNTRVLNVPKANLKSMGERAYFIIAPKMFNQLPKQVRLNYSLQSFKTELKSLYTREAFSGLD